MEYSTAVEVTGGSQPSAGTVEDVTTPEDNLGNAAFAGDASALADAVLTEQDKEAVAAYSPELVLATPSLMFHCDDVALKREELLKAGVHVGANRKNFGL